MLEARDKINSGNEKQSKNKLLYKEYAAREDLYYLFDMV